MRGDGSPGAWHQLHFCGDPGGGRAELQAPAVGLGGTCGRLGILKFFQRRGGCFFFWKYIKLNFCGSGSAILKICFS